MLRWKKRRRKGRKKLCWLDRLVSANIIGRCELPVIIAIYLLLNNTLQGTCRIHVRYAPASSDCESWDIFWDNSLLSKIKHTSDTTAMKHWKSSSLFWGDNVIKSSSIPRQLIFLPFFVFVVSHFAYALWLQSNFWRWSCPCNIIPIVSCVWWESRNKQ